MPGCRSLWRPSLHPPSPPRILRFSSASSPRYLPPVPPLLAAPLARGVRSPPPCSDRAHPPMHPWMHIRDAPHLPYTGGNPGIMIPASARLWTPSPNPNAELMLAISRFSHRKRQLLQLVYRYYFLLSFWSIIASILGISPVYFFIHEISVDNSSEFVREYFVENGERRITYICMQCTKSGEGKKEDKTYLIILPMIE